jgi:hypothetical protein
LRTAAAFATLGKVRPRVLLPLTLALACARKDAAPIEAPSQGDGPGVEQNTFVSTSHNETRREPKIVEAGEGEIEGDYAVKSAERAKEIAHAAVEDQLDPKKTWRLSPVFPTSWPSKEQSVAVYFYPMAANPRALQFYQLFSAAYRVDVSLVDGTTKVVAIPKPRMLGTIEETRPSSLERRELELAEASLVRQLLGADLRQGENTFWGYLKFVHEHPEIGKDVSRRQGAFMAWIKTKDKR